jgi:alkylhydroperoxidase family enzyme
MPATVLIRADGTVAAVTSCLRGHATGYSGDAPSAPWRRRSLMRIEPVEKERAEPVVRRIYDAIEQQTGRVGNFFKMLGNQPELLRAFNQLYGVVWAEGALAAKLKELAYLRVSILNGCGY